MKTERDPKAPVKVTITDPESGEVFEEKILRDDYMLVCAGRRYLKSYQLWGSTVQLNVAYDNGKKRDAS